MLRDVTTFHIFIEILLPLKIPLWIRPCITCYFDYYAYMYQYNT